MTITIQQVSLLAGAHGVYGPTAVVDVFRAFSAAAYAIDGGADRIVLADGLDEARDLSRRLGSALLMGEDEGVRPADFDLGNSPAEIVRAGDLTGTTIVHRSSAGTRVARAAKAAGARPLYVAAFVVATATARHLCAAAGPDGAVFVVAAGRGGTRVADEDEACAALIGELVPDRSVDPGPSLDRAARGEGARRLASASWADPDDLAMCLDLDRFGFAMRAVSDDDLVVVRQCTEHVPIG